MSGVSLPAAVAQLIRELAERGYVVASDESGDVRGRAWRTIELRQPASGSERAVRLYLERGRWDSAAIKLSDEWHTSYHVLRAIAGDRLDERAESHDERRQNTIAAVERLPADTEQLHTINARLGEYNDEWRARYTRKS